MLQWILQHHLTENVLRTGLCAEAAALLLEMVRVTLDKVSVLLQGQCSVNGPLAFLCPHRAILSITVSKDFICYVAQPGQ